MALLAVAETTLYYTEAGSGPAVVLLHGLYQDADCWAPFLADLSQRHRVISYDLRGSGRSGDGGAVTVATLAADLGVLLDTLGIQRAAIVGHSLGGQAALQFAVDNPGRVSALVLAGVSPLPMDAAIAPAYGAFAQLAPALGLTDKLAAAMLALVYSADSLDHGAGGAELYRRHLTLLRRPQEVAGQITAMLGRADVAERLAAIVCPTLIVTGDLDTTVGLHCPQFMLARIAGAELLVLPDASHMAPFERAEAFKGGLLAFLGRAHA